MLHSCHFYLLCFCFELLFFIVDLEQIMGASREIKIDHFYVESLLNISNQQNLKIKIKSIKKKYSGTLKEMLEGNRRFVQPQTKTEFCQPLYLLA